MFLKNYLTQIFVIISGFATLSLAQPQFQGPGAQAGQGAGGARQSGIGGINQAPEAKHFENRRQIVTAQPKVDTLVAPAPKVVEKFEPKLPQSINPGSLHPDELLQYLLRQKHIADSKASAQATKDSLNTLKCAEKKLDPKACEAYLAQQNEPNWLQQVNGALGAFFMYDLSQGALSVPAYDLNGPIMNDKGEPVLNTVKLPFIVVWLIIGALFFTIRFRFINIRGFLHAIQVVRGKFDDPSHKGDISHFKALTSALSATVGLGNIAGVAVAISLGGPGATVWMIIFAFFGMSSKFASATLGQIFRKTNPDGTISGGPMYYLDIGLKKMGLAKIGKILGISYAFLVMLASLGGGNMFQANQTVGAFINGFDIVESEGVKWGFGFFLAISVGIVILGGIKRIGQATSKVVPAMVVLYITASFIIIFKNIDSLPHTIHIILSEAFNTNALFGGVIGGIITGVQRAAFSTEAGLGSAAIAHAAAKTDKPVREGLVAMLGPFIDTVVICLMTALVVTITGTWNMPGLEGVQITTEAFSAVAPWFPKVLAISIALFAYSTMISWCYYGERGWIYLFNHFGSDLGHKTLVIFKFIFIAAVVVGSVHQFSDILTFTDLAILSLALPNIIGAIMLSGIIWRALDDYWRNHRNELE